MILRLHKEGVAIAEIARRLGRSRQTIYNRMKHRPRPAPPKRASKLDPFKSHIKARLERFDLPATVLLREVRTLGYTGGITILREYVAQIKNRQVRRLVDRFETEPGRQAQMDWASCGTIVHNGRNRRLSLLVVVLGYSRFFWARFVTSEQQPVLLASLETAFRSLGGVPKELLVDNLKSVVAQPRSKDKPAVVQTSFRSFAEHWGFDVKACPPYWPRAKGKVERGISYIKQCFLEGREFSDLEDLNSQLRVWLSTVANDRLHGTTKRKPSDLLLEDQRAMHPTRSSSFPRALVAQRLADWDARISYAGVRYSVDPSIIGRRRGVAVQVHVSADKILRIFHDGHLVGEHLKAEPNSPPQDDPLHAAQRQRLRQMPNFIRSKETVSFDQNLLMPDDAPVVITRDLSVYEGASL